MRKIAVPALVALATVACSPAVTSPTAVTTRAARSHTATARATPHPATATARPSARPTASSAPATAAKSKDVPMAVTCLSAKSCVAVGQNSATQRPFALTWNGTKWSVTSLRVPKSGDFGILNAVSCAAVNSCVAVGISGARVAMDTSQTEIPFEESWNGTRWTASRLPAPAGNDGAVPDGVSCPSPTSCVATGAYSLADGRHVGFAEVLHGATWTVFQPPGLRKSTSTLENVSCTSTASCVAVGSYGPQISPAGDPAGTAVAEFWDGRKWHESALPMPSGTRYVWLSDISCLPSKTCVAVGGRYLPGSSGRYLPGKNNIGPLAEAWRAGKWEAATPQASGGDPVLSGVSCVSAANCVAVGGGDSQRLRNAAFSDSWNGRGWRFVRLPTPSGGGYPNSSSGQDVSCVSATDCVAVGFAGPAAQLFSFGFSASWNGRSWRLIATS